MLLEDKKDWLKSCDLYKQIYDDVDEFATIIIRKMAELETDYIDFRGHIRIGYRDRSNDKDEIFATGIHIKTDFFRFATAEPRNMVEFKLRNRRYFQLNNFNVNDFLLLVDVVEELDKLIWIKKIKENKIRIHFENANVLITDPAYIVKDNKDEDVDISDEFDEIPSFSEFNPITANNWNRNNMNIVQISQYYDAILEYQNKYKDKQKEIKEKIYADKRGLSDWDKTECGEDMSAIGLKKWLTSETFYGDWSCTVYDDKEEILGEFCADSGMVGVFDYDEVLRYNPNFEIELCSYKPYIGTVIKNFTGDIYFDIDIIEKENPEFWKEKGLCGLDYRLSVVGKGNINFKSKQTGY